MHHHDGYYWRGDPNPFVYSPLERSQAAGSDNRQSRSPVEGGGSECSLDLVTAGTCGENIMAMQWHALW